MSAAEFLLYQTAQTKKTGPDRQNWQPNEAQVESAEK